jgi:arginine decarboxylase
MSDWSIQQARASYNIPYWGNGYYDINAEGRLFAYPERDPGRGIDLLELVERVHAEGLTLPILLRFNGILHDRVNTLVGAFNTEMEKDGYQGRYTAVYPIKVNQQHSVVEQILHRGDESVGLEAGSKPELMAVLGMVPVGGMVVCNGYKDREYIRQGDRPSGLHRGGEALGAAAGAGGVARAWRRTVAWPAGAPLLARQRQVAK